MKGLSECCDNLLRGNLSTSAPDIKKLKKHKNVIRQVADKKLSNKRKVNLIVQQGAGFFGPLLALLAPLIGGLLSK